jgi:hypothetical protein
LLFVRLRLSSRFLTDHARECRAWIVEIGSMSGVKMVMTQGRA